MSVNRNQKYRCNLVRHGPVSDLAAIILPQAMRAILPGMSNDVIGMIKARRSPRSYSSTN